MAKKKCKNDVMTISKIYETIQAREFLHELWWDVLSDIKEKPTYKRLKHMVDEVIENTVGDFDIPFPDEAEQSRRRTAMTEISIMTYTVDTVISEVLYRKFHNEYQSLVKNIIQDLLTKKNSKDVPSDVKGGSVFENIERIFSNDSSKKDNGVGDASQVTQKSKNSMGESSGMPPRKRGRPKKIAAGDAQDAEAKTKVPNSEPKRKRGRPPITMNKGHAEKELKAIKPKVLANKKQNVNAHLDRENDAESDVSVGNLSIATVSSVRTSELSSFEDAISIGSDDEDGEKKLIPLKVANEMYLHGKLSQIYNIGKMGEKQKLMQKASAKSTKSKARSSSSANLSSPLRKILPQRIRKPNSKYNSETMYCEVKDYSSHQVDSGSSSSEDDAFTEPRRKPKRRKTQSSEEEKDSRLLSSPVTKKPFVLLNSSPRNSSSSKKEMIQDHGSATKNSKRYDASDLYKPRPVIGSNLGSRSTAKTLFST